MKKFVFASVMVLASLCLFTAPTLKAQDLSIKDPAEYNAYQNATTQSDPKAKAAALEGFLTSYPQSIVKGAVLDLLLELYSAPPPNGLADNDKTLSTATRILQLDPNNLRAILSAVYVKKGQCARTQDVQTCDDAAALSQKGLIAPKPAAIADADWKSLTHLAYPLFHSTLALDDQVSKKDFKAAVAEYRAELMLYTDDESKVAGLNDTLLLAQAYTNPDVKDYVNAVWFYSRVVDFAPAAYKVRIEPQLEQVYRRYHGSLDGLDAIKAQAAITTFPPGTYHPDPDKTPAEKIHIMLTDPTIKKDQLALSDKETIIAFGSKDDAESIWAVMKDQVTPVPGIVIEASATVIKVAVTDDAKAAKIADFLVNLKTPLADKDIPAVGFEFKLQPAAQLNGTYDNYTQIPAKDAVPATTTTPAVPATAQSAQIVLRDGFIQPEEKKKPVAHKPAAGHRAAAAH
jgi:hypothetical protein